MNAETPLDEDFDDEDIEFTPRVAVLGAGPIGLEAALYARYLGYEVAVLEKATVASNVLRWGHVTMFSPFARNRSPLGVAAIQAQFEDHAWPADDALLAGRDYAERYLLPLAQTDLLSGCIHEQVTVRRVARDGIRKSDTDGLSRSDYQFRILVQTPEGEDVIEADFVIDTTGVFDQPNNLGHGGMPALGELGLPASAPLLRHVPDILGSERERFENKRVLVIGNGYSAATSIVALHELHRQAAETQVTWITRRAAEDAGPMPIAQDDRLAERQRLAAMANEAAQSSDSGIELVDQTAVLAIDPNEDHTLQVTLGGKQSGQYVFDVVVALTGYHPDSSLYSELQVERCKATDGPRPLSQWLLSLGTIDALDQSLPDAQILETGEPDFFILGSKSFGRNSNFLLALGLEQIRAAFSVIADRENLDLYATMSHLA